MSLCAVALQRRLLPPCAAPRRRPTHAHGVTGRCAVRLFPIANISHHPTARAPDQPAENLPGSKATASARKAVLPDT